MSLPSFNRSTTTAEMAATIEERGPGRGENLVEYGLFVTEGFGDPAAPVPTFVDDPAAPNQIDGFTNDDSYRTSRHLIRKIAPQAQEGTTGVEAAASIAFDEERLRESSLARQLAEKKDQPATIRLIRRRKPEEMVGVSPLEPQLPWVNLIPPNTKFFLESVSENREEKVQVMDTFGEFVAFFFGRRPEVYAYSGTLLNAKNHDWKNEFQENYDNFLRGSQAVKFRATMLLQYDDVLVEGYMMNCQTQQTGVMDKAVPFSFNLLVLNRSPMNPRNMLGMRFRRAGGTTAEQALFNSLQEALDLTNAGRIDDLQTFLVMREYFAGNYVPAAGNVVHTEGDGQVTSGANAQPGTKGGQVDARPMSAPFTPSTTGKILQSGVVGDFPGGSLQGAA